MHNMRQYVTITVSHLKSLFIFIVNIVGTQIYNMKLTSIATLLFISGSEAFAPSAKSVRSNGEFRHKDFVLVELWVRNVEHR